MNHFSMKTKMALAVSLLFVVVIALLAWGALSYQEQALKAAISRQQFTMVSSLAANIDDKLRFAQTAVITSARQIPRAALEDADAAQRFLDARFTLHAIFDNGLFLISRDGRLIAESPFLPGRRGVDMTSFEFTRQTLATGQPYISHPYTSAHTPGHPAIFLAAPILDGEQRVVAMLGGSLDLWGTNFLKDLSLARYGDSSYFILLDRQRTILVHPDRNKILTRDLPPGGTALYERALQGFAGSAETAGAQGEELLTSIRPLATTGWILSANYPAAEAYAPMRGMRNYFLLISLVLTVAVLGLTWLLMRRLTAPLDAFTRHVEALPNRVVPTPLAKVESGDEIGILAQAFNRMLTSLEVQKAGNEARLETLLRLNEMGRATHQEIADFVLEEGVKLTHSKIGYLAFVNADETVLTMYSWSRHAMEQCAIIDKPLEYPVAGTGLWGEAIRQRRPVITNDYAAANPCKKGYPAGHVELRRHMNVPIFDGERIVVVAGVGNKADEYDDTDVRQLTLLMQGMWRLIQRRRVEEALQQEKAKFSLAFRTVPSVLVISTLTEGVYLEVNEAYEQLLGYRRDEVIGRRVHEFPIWVDPEDRARVVRMLERGEKVRNLEIRFRSKEGTTLTGLFAAEVIDVGAERCLLSLVNDITARKEVEEALRRSEARYRSLYNETPVMLHSIDRDGRLVSVSNFWLDSLGYSRSEVLGRFSSEFLTEASKRYAEEVVIPEFFLTGNCREAPYQLVKKNGEVLDVLLSAIAERDETGRIVRSLAVMIDVTERKRAQEDIEQLNAALAARALELENANRELEAFSYSVSHDLRNPLTAISGYCQLLMAACGSRLTAEEQGYLEEVLAGADHMNDLIDALLKLACLTRSELHRTSVDLSAMAHKVAAELTLTGPQRQVTFRIADGIVVDGDEKMLRVVLENLLGNAWKYTACRSEAVIDFGCAEVDGKTACFVRDNGTGFAMADAGQLFVPFRRLPGAEAFAGHGIGLGTVERIIRRHGGHIWAEAEPGRGATFWFTL